MSRWMRGFLFGCAFSLAIFIAVTLYMEAIRHVRSKQPTMPGVQAGHVPRGAAAAPRLPRQGLLPLRQVRRPVQLSEEQRRTLQWLPLVERTLDRLEKGGETHRAPR